MAQEFSNSITISGDLRQRQLASAEILTSHQTNYSNWDVVRLEIYHGPPIYGHYKEDETRWKFYSRNSPQGLDVVSQKFPELVFQCSLWDMSGGECHRFKLQNNIESDWDTSTTNLDGDEQSEDVQPTPVGELLCKCAEGVVAFAAIYEGCMHSFALSRKDAGEVAVRLHEILSHTRYHDHEQA